MPTVTIQCPPLLIVGTRQGFKAQLEALAHGGADRIVIDCAECGYIDGSGLGMLVGVQRRIKPTRVVLAGLNEDLRVLLELTHLDTLFEIEGRVAA